MKSKIKSAAVFFSSALIALSMCGCIIIAPPAAQKPAEEPAEELQKVEGIKTGVYNKIKDSISV